MLMMTFSLKVSEMVEAVMISDYRADVETSLSLAKVLMLMLMLMLMQIKNSDQDEVFHIMDSIMRDREDCYVVRNSAVG